MNPIVSLAPCFVFSWITSDNFDSQIKTVRSQNGSECFRIQGEQVDTLDGKAHGFFYKVVVPCESGNKSA